MAGRNLIVSPDFFLEFISPEINSIASKHCFCMDFEYITNISYYCSTDDFKKQTEILYVEISQRQAGYIFEVVIELGAWSLESFIQSLLFYLSELFLKYLIRFIRMTPTK